MQMIDGETGMTEMQRLLPLAVGWCSHHRGHEAVVKQPPV